MPRPVAFAFRFLAQLRSAPFRLVSCRCAAVRPGQFGSGPTARRSRWALSACRGCGAGHVIARPMAWWLVQVRPGARCGSGQRPSRPTRTGRCVQECLVARAFPSPPPPTRPATPPDCPMCPIRFRNASARHGAAGLLSIIRLLEPGERGARLFARSVDAPARAITATMAG